MKKLLVAVLVLVTVFAYAKNGNNTQSEELGPVQFDANYHVFNVMESGTWVIQLNQSTSVNGQVNEFGYYVYSNGIKSEPIPFTTGLTGNAQFSLPNLKEGDKIEFYVVTEQHDQNGSSVPELTEFNIIPTPGNSAHGNVVYGVEWPNNNNLSFHNASFTPEPAPAGQPLPGALTTMLVAGGCAAYLKRKKAARK